MSSRQVLPGAIEECPVGCSIQPLLLPALSRLFAERVVGAMSQELGSLKIVGEVAKLSIVVAESMVEERMDRKSNAPSQS